MDKNEVIIKFKELYGGNEEFRVFHSPGRVNLIGEYTDFNGGYVFPCALDFGIFAVASKRDDGKVSFKSTNFDLSVISELSDIQFKDEDGWANYPKGVIKELLDMKKHISGLNILYSGNIPNGAGLSSSAALEVLTAVIFNEIFNLSIDMIDLVRLSQRAENNFVGVMCGIMDQFAVGMGKEKNAVLLNCNTLDFKYAPLDITGYKLVIANTNKIRGLTDSKYNERRRECEAALSDLNTQFNLSCLCDLSYEEFQNSSQLIKDEAALKRAKHVISENERTQAAVNALKAGDLEAFGLLLNESHISLRDDFEVTGAELDTLALAARQFDGCIGARMTGAGFGGCTISIVKENKVEDFKRGVGKVYTEKTGLTADFYVAEPGDGAMELK